MTVGKETATLRDELHLEITPGAGDEEREAADIPAEKEEGDGDDRRDPEDPPNG